MATSGCSYFEGPAHEKKRKPHKLHIVCTTGIIADGISEMAGDKATIYALMQAGVDPHLYKPTYNDLRQLLDADIVFCNGLHLEGKMGDVLRKLQRQKKVVYIGEALCPTLVHQLAGQTDTYDPHIWFDVSIWARCMQTAALALQQSDTTNRLIYYNNAARYNRQLDSLHHWVKDTLQTIPATQRVLITAHDAFGYFSTAYHIEVKGLQGISTLSEYGLQDVSNLTQFIYTRKIKAVFVESSVSSQSLEAVVEGCRSKGHIVKIGGQLYADALGAPLSPAGTYIGMIKTNVRTIVSGLKK